MFKADETSHPLKIPANVPTAWSKYQHQGYYTLGSLWLAVVYKALKQGEFNKVSQQMGIQLVNI